MQGWRRLFLAALMCAGLIGPLAAPASPLPAPEPRLRHEGMEWHLNGVGTVNYLLLDVYQVALYLPQRHQDAQAVLGEHLPRRVHITLLQDVVAERDLDFFLRGLEDNNPAVDLLAIRDQLEYFLRAFRDQGKLSKGSVVVLEYLPQVGTRFWLNQRLLGILPGPTFNRALLKIWLGEKPVQKHIKRALLGQGRDAL